MQIRQNIDKIQRQGTFLLNSKEVGLSKSITFLRSPYLGLQKDTQN